MEVFRYNKNNSKWYKKIDWIKILVIFIISFFIFFLFFNAIGNDTDKALFTSFFVSFLISFNYVLSDLIENRDRVFILDKSTLGYVEIHKELSGKFLRTNEFYSILRKEDIDDIFNKNYLFEGIDKGEILSINYIKKKSSCIVVKANVKEKRWKSISKFFISKVYLVEKKYKKKIIIPNDLDEYSKIYRFLKERNDKNV